MIKTRNWPNANYSSLLPIILHKQIKQYKTCQRKGQKEKKTIGPKNKKIYVLHQVLDTISDESVKNSKRVAMKDGREKETEKNDRGYEEGKVTQQ